jgi:Putative DNA-binding domain
MTLPFRLLETTQADIQRLVDTGATEGPHLDFKRDFPTRWDNEHKVKLLADVTAFANAGGGDIIYGIDEDEEARASAIVPQTLSNLDEEIRRLLDVVLNQVEPRVQGVQVQTVPVSVGTGSGAVIVMRIPQSWGGPHRNRINQHFHIRQSRRNHALDVPEVRSLFLGAEGQAQRMRDFRTERLGKIVIRDTPSVIDEGPCLVVHVLPTQAMRGLVQVDPVPYSQRRRTLPIIGTQPAGSLSLNLDGAVGSIPAAGEFKAGYTQQFRQGFFEAVWVLRPFSDCPEPMLPHVYYERHVIRFVEEVRIELTAHSVSTEVVVFVSLLGANEAIFAGRSDFGIGYSKSRFDRRDVLLPDVLISTEQSAGNGMHSTFDFTAVRLNVEQNQLLGVV